MLEKTDVVWRIPDLLGVEDDLVGLSSLCEAGNDLVGDIRAQVYAESKGEVMKADNVTQLLATSEL